MDTNSNQPQTKTFFHIEDNDETVSVKVEGKAKDLINLFANVIDEDKNMRQVIELALLAVKQKNGEEIDPMEALMAMMSMGRGSKEDEG